MGIENLIRAMQEVAKSIPDIYLIIGGSGPLKEQLAMTSRRLNLDHLIRFTGFIPEEDLPEYYRLRISLSCQPLSWKDSGWLRLKHWHPVPPCWGHRWEERKKS